MSCWEAINHAIFSFIHTVVIKLYHNLHNLRLYLKLTTINIFFFIPSNLNMCRNIYFNICNMCRNIYFIYLIPAVISTAISTAICAAICAAINYLLFVPLYVMTIYFSLKIAVFKIYLTHNAILEPKIRGLVKNVSNFPGKMRCFVVQQVVQK